MYADRGGHNAHGRRGRTEAAVLHPVGQRDTPQPARRAGGAGPARGKGLGPAEGDERGRGNAGAHAPGRILPQQRAQHLLRHAELPAHPQFDRGPGVQGEAAPAQLRPRGTGRHGLRRAEEEVPQGGVQAAHSPESGRGPGLAGGRASLPAPGPDRRGDRLFPGLLPPAGADGVPQQRTRGLLLGGRAGLPPDL